MMIRAFVAGLGAALVAALLLPAPTAFAQSAKPAPAVVTTVAPGTPSIQPASSGTLPPAPAATPQVYTPIACAVLVKRANIAKQTISAHTVGALTEAALRAHDFDALFAATAKAQAAALKAKAALDPVATTATNDAVVKSRDAAALSLYRAQADVRACFGLR